MKTSASRHLALAFVATLVIACGEPATPPPPEPVRVENAELDLAIAALPEPFQPVATDGEAIELTAPGANGPGTVRITLGPPANSGINLVEAAKARGAAFEAAPSGVFHGHRSLGGALGNVFTARGGYRLEDGTEVEETWAYALHPRQKNRMLTITYTYPTGESQERVNQLLYLLGEIEALSAAGEPASDPPA